ncbi:MAG: YvcK family protein [Armatimonadota bacterium]|nr:YvcK family protein [bacterium]MDW8320697.1 YvcK family protein [Armatimonadota bacterium]
MRNGWSLNQMLHLPSARWLMPGMLVKRWLLLAMVGTVIMFGGVLILIDVQSPEWLSWLHRQVQAVSQRFTPGSHGRIVLTIAGAGIALTGLAMSLIGVRGLVRTVACAIDPVAGRRLAHIIYNRRNLQLGPQLVAVGGGTGLSTLLRGLKQYSSNVTAIVTVTDDGGSSGKLTEQFGVLPPGDIRNCLVALADAEPIMTELFQYRFRGSEGLGGHSFGNLLIVAMTNITGDFERAIRETSKVLAIRGRVLPSTLDHVRLRAKMEDGSYIEGETAIASSPLKIRQMMLTPPSARPLDEALQAIREAEVIVLGPGSVFTSVIPNLLVEGIAEAIRGSHALRVYVCNVMTQPGETDGFTASDHIRAIEAHCPPRLFDYVLVNTTRPSSELMERYRQSGAEFVEPDIDRIRAMGYRTVVGDFISQTDVVRHDPHKLADAILHLLSRRK